MPQGLGGTAGRGALIRSETGRGVLIVLMIDSLANGLFVPLSLLYLVQTSGSSLALVGTLLAVAGVVSLPLPLWIGRMVDRFGAKPAVLAAQLVQAVGAAVYLVAVNSTLVFVGALFSLAGQRIFWSSAFTLVSEISDGDPDSRARERWFAAVAVLRAIGYGVGALMAGLAISTAASPLWRVIVVVDGVLLLAAAGIVALWVPRRHGGSSKPVAAGGYRRLWGDHPYLGLVALNTGFALCNLMLAIAFPPFVALALPSLLWIIGPLLALNTIVQAIGQQFVVRLIRGLPRHVSLCFAGVLWAAWCLLMAAALAVPAALRAPCLLLGVLCYSAAQLIHGPVSNAMATDAAPLEVRGRYLATFQYSFAVAGIVAPALFTLLAQAGPAVPWLVLAGVAGLTVPLGLLLARHLPEAALTGQRTVSRQA